MTDNDTREKLAERIYGFVREGRTDQKYTDSIETIKEDYRHMADSILSIMAGRDDVSALLRVELAAAKAELAKVLAAKVTEKAESDEESRCPTVQLSSGKQYPMSCAECLGEQPVEEGRINGKCVNCGMDLSIERCAECAECAVHLFGAGVARPNLGGYPAKVSGPLPSDPVPPLGPAQSEQVSFDDTRGPEPMGLANDDDRNAWRKYALEATPAIVGAVHATPDVCAYADRMLCEERKRVAIKTPGEQELRVIFSEQPLGPESNAVFIEVENNEGYSVNAGQWREFKDGTWALVFTRQDFEKR